MDIVTVVTINEDLKKNIHLNIFKTLKKYCNHEIVINEKLIFKSKN